MHVPMIFSWPGQVRKGVVSQALVELVDIPQTLLEAAGLPEGEGMQGESLWPLLTGAVPPDVHKPYVLCEYLDALGMPDAAAHAGEHVLRRPLEAQRLSHATGRGSSTTSQADPSELNDLWDDPGASGAALRR